MNKRIDELVEDYGDVFKEGGGVGDYLIPAIPSPDFNTTPFRTKMTERLMPGLSEISGEEHRALQTEMYGIGVIEQIEDETGEIK